MLSLRIPHSTPQNTPRSSKILLSLPFKLNVHFHQFFKLHINFI
eukprot:UN28477